MSYANLAAIYELLDLMDEVKRRAREAWASHLDHPAIHSALYQVAFLQHDLAATKREGAILMGKQGWQDQILDFDSKSVQAQMRHSHISTTMDIYAQFVPEFQRGRWRRWPRWWKTEPSNRRELSIELEHSLRRTRFNWNAVEHKSQKRVRKSFRLVELVGIEPTTSSLRTMRSPS